MKKYLEIWNVTKTYPTPKGPAVIVQDFTLILPEGEFVCLIGHSGCGKSTVLSMVAGLSETSGGALVLADREITGPGPDRGMVFQSPCLLPWLTAVENVMLGVDEVFHARPAGERREIAEHHLDLVGLGDCLTMRPSELSAGMKQRVGLARAFALSPKLLLLDEPFGMLDALTRMELQEVLLELLTREKKTVLMVTHDVDEALFVADRIAMMTSGPAARLGDVLDVPFERPRERRSVLDHPSYYVLREKLIGFLEEQAAPDDRPPPAASAASASAVGGATTTIDPPAEPPSRSRPPKPPPADAARPGRTNGVATAPAREAAAPSRVEPTIVELVERALFRPTRNAEGAVESDTGWFDDP